MRLSLGSTKWNVLQQTYTLSPLPAHGSTAGTGPPSLPEPSVVAAHRVRLAEAIEQPEPGAMQREVARPRTHCTQRRLEQFVVYLQARHLRQR